MASEFHPVYSVNSVGTPAYSPSFVWFVCFVVKRDSSLFPQLIRYPAIDPASFRASVVAICHSAG